MSRTSEHTCRVCGKTYYACDPCDAQIGKSWRSIVCTEGHYKAYYALWQYGQGQIDKDELKAVLDEQNAREWENSPVKDVIDSVYQEEKPVQAEPVREQAGQNNFYYKGKKNHR